MNLLQIKEEGLNDIINILEPVFQRVGINFYYLIGAAAKDIWYSKEGIISRKTNDIDFAILVADIGQFQQVKTILETEYNFNRVASNEFTLISNSGLTVDLLPFGNQVEINDGVLVNGIGLHNIKVNGFQEIAQSAVQEIQQEQGIFRIATLPAIILLKLIAYDDRPEQRTKDAQDIAHIINVYFDIETNLFFDEHYDLLVRIDEGNHIIAARVIGRLLRQTLNHNSILKQRVISIITNHTINQQGNKFVELMSTAINKTIEDGIMTLKEIVLGIQEGEC
jgi:predicted nucleotidyltransferase